MNLIKRLFCKHTDVFYRNIYGDEIAYFGYKRSIWECTKCGRFVLSNELVDATKGDRG